jgi:hypothetical protein
MSVFLTSPEGNSYSLFRIGGAKAVDSGFLLLGTGAEEILEYIATPTDVGLGWREALVDLLRSYRPNRPIRQIDWVGIAAMTDFEWAKDWAASNGWAIPEPPQGAPAPTASSTQPKRRPGSEATTAD